MTEVFTGRSYAPSNVPGWPDDPATGLPFDYGKIADKTTADIEGLTARATFVLESIGGTGNHFTAETVLATNDPPGLASLPAGMRFIYFPTTENTGDVLADIDDVPDVEVLANDGTQVPAGYFKVGSCYPLISNGTALIVEDVGSSVIAGNRAPDCVLWCQRTAGTADGGSTSGSMQERLLNTTALEDTRVSLDAGTGHFTVQPGRWMIRWSVPMYSSGRFISELYNLTDSTVDGYGSSAESGSADMAWSHGVAFVTLATAKEFVIRTRCQTTKATTGFGQAANLGSSPELYTRVEITDIDESGDDLEGLWGGPDTYLYEWTDTAISPDADPGNGKVGTDTGDFSSATKLFISETDGQANGIAATLSHITGGAGVVLARVRLVSKSDRTKWTSGEITSQSDGGTYRVWGWSFIDGQHTFDAGTEFLVQMQRLDDLGTADGLLTSFGADLISCNDKDEAQALLEIDARDAASVTHDDSTADLSTETGDSIADVQAAINALAARGAYDTLSNADETLTAAMRIAALMVTLTAPRTKTLPLAADYNTKTPFIVVIGSGVSSTNYLNVIPQGSDTINDGAALQVVRPYSVLFFFSDGINKWTGWVTDAVEAEATIAAATTTNLGSARAQAIEITGVGGETINSFGSTAPVGAIKFCRMSVLGVGFVTITHSSSILLPNGSTVTLYDGECFIAEHSGGGNWFVYTVSGSSGVTWNNLQVSNLQVAALLDLSAGQIQFPATQIPSSNANTLDDYEEGTYTPVQSFVTAGTSSWASVTANGIYTKIGRKCTFSADMTATPTIGTGSGNLQTTVPFASAGGVPFVLAAALFSSVFSWPASRTQVNGSLASGTTQAILPCTGSGQSSSNIAASNMTSGSAHAWRISGSYFTA